MLDKNKDTSTKVFQREKLKDQLVIKERNDLTEKQKEIISLILDKKSQIIFINGPAGSAKTFLSVYCGLRLLNAKSVSEIIYIRTLAESASKGMGFLPGELDNKFQPFTTPLEDKLEEFLSKGDIDKIYKEERIKLLPVNFLRGSSFNAKYIFLEEAQNFTYQELTTAITRIGRYSKLVIVGDDFQADINGKSGFRKMLNIFNDEESRNNGIFVVQLDKSHIVRNGIIKFLLEKIEANK